MLITRFKISGIQHIAPVLIFQRTSTLVKQPFAVPKPFSVLARQLEVTPLLGVRKNTQEKITLSISNKYATQTGGLLDRLKNVIGLGKFSKNVSRAVGYRLYASIEDHVSHDIFFKELKMADTFHSWFIVRSLHVWMLMVRLMNEGENGRLVRNALVEAMWEDVDLKSRHLGETATSVRRKQIQTLVDEFQGNLFAYDEGLLSSDQVLAGAIWRNLLLQGDFDPQKLEVLVDYVRENIACLDKSNYKTIYKECKVDWIKIRL